MKKLSFDEAKKESSTTKIYGFLNTAAPNASNLVEVVYESKYNAFIFYGSNPNKCIPQLVLEPYWRNELESTKEFIASKHWSPEAKASKGLVESFNHNPPAKLNDWDILSKSTLALIHPQSYNPRTLYLVTKINLELPDEEITYYSYLHGHNVSYKKSRFVIYNQECLDFLLCTMMENYIGSDADTFKVVQELVAVMQLALNNEVPFGIRTDVAKQSPIPILFGSYKINLVPTGFTANVHCEG